MGGMGGFWRVVVVDKLPKMQGFISMYSLTSLPFAVLFSYICTGAALSLEIRLLPRNFDRKKHQFYRILSTCRAIAG